MVYRDYLDADPTYTEARKTNESVSGWDFRPEPSRDASGFWIAVIAVGLVLICIAAVGAAQAL